MRQLIKTVVLFSLLCAAGPAAWANAYSDAIRVFANAGESGRYFKTAYGYAIFPTIGKGGLVVGYAYGEGKVFVNSKHVGNSIMTQFTAGAQIGEARIAVEARRCVIRSCAGRSC